MPTEIAEILRRDNPILLGLEQSYAAMQLPFGHTQWKTHQHNGIDIANFRGEGAYLGQGGQDQEARYRTMFDYVVYADSDHWLDCLDEDNAFGVITYDFPMPDGSLKTVSRDLLDSIMEIYFIKEVLGAFPDKLLDIGAGYGRLAHRLTSLYPQQKITCIDAIPVSTFLCAFYSQYRGFENACTTMPFTAVGSIEAGDFDMVMNIHSFSEQSWSSINWWLGRCADWKIKYLYLIPHDPRFVCVNEDGSIGDFRPLLERHGYKLIYEKPKYPPRSQGGLYAEVVRYLYERKP